MKFNSQICTTKEQSERLLALGLKKETADMAHVALQRWNGNDYENTDKCEIIVLDEELAEYYNRVFSTDDLDTYCPAWSLHRLIEMMPQGIQDCSYRCFVLAVNSEGVSYEYHYIDEDGEGYNDLIGCTDLFDNLYDDIIAHIEWLIKEGYLYNEYLEEQL